MFIQINVKVKKTIVIDSNIEDDNYDDDNKEVNKLVSRLKELEYEKKKLALKERGLSLSEREAEVAKSM